MSARIYLFFLVWLFLLPSAAVRAQAVSAPSWSTPSNGSLVASTASRTIHGQVVNALTGAAIPRALVNLNSRQVLTDWQGRFEFAGFTDDQASASVTKPGYSQTAEAGETYVHQKIVDPSATVEIKLYPNAVINGTVAGQDGLPLSQIPITLRRANYGVTGLRWVNAGFSMSNSRGEYRFVVPAGRYRLALGYNPRIRETQDAVLPLTFPPASSSNASASWIALLPGEEKQINLRPKTGQTHPVAIRVERAGSRQNVRFTAVPANGEVINLNSSSGAAPGEYRVQLPVGSYLIHAQSDTREESLFGTSHVTVTDEDAASLTLHLAPTTSLPIEVTIDPASQPQTAPAGFSAVANVAQFGLTLHEVSGDADGPNSDIPVRPREDRTFEFRVPPGRYRLTGNNGGPWYVESATYGGVSNLLTSDLVIAAGSAGEPIRLVVGNVLGSVRGQVALPAGVPMAWVCLFPRQPALAVSNPQPTGSDGSFVMAAPVGSYSVAAFAHRIQEDLKDPETLERLTVGAKTVEVTSGTNPSVNLELSLFKEVPE